MEENKDNNQNNDLENSMFSDTSNDSPSMFSDSLFADSPNTPAEPTEPIEPKESENETNVLEESAKTDENPPTEQIEQSFFSEQPTEQSIFGKQNADESVEDIDETLNEEDSQNNTSDSLITVRPVKFQHFKDSKLNLSIKKNLDILQDIPMHITVELGRTKSTIKDIINMNIGSVVELNKIAGEQVEIFVNEKLVARGEVIVIEDKFGVRVVNTNIPKEII